MPLLKAGTCAMISVRDTGAGMSPAVRARIFEPFFTTKSVGEGSGLGLSVVHGIIVEHGGTIVVESEPGQGSRFDIYLPLSSAVVPAAAVATEAAGDTVERVSGGRVLLVEDEPSVGRVIVRGLGRMGFETQLLGDPREALAAVTAAPSAFDVVITDLTMPGMNGVELAKRLLAVRPDLPVILYSGDITSVTESARAAGIREVLEKPASLAALGGAVRRVLA
jgi:CheY-like chemotaxis protein